jgi:hypothetical protein
MESKKADERDLERQMWAATETLREAVLQLLQAGDLHPNVVVLAVARVAGETGSATALASGENIEQQLGELVEVVRRAGRDPQEVLQAEGMLPAGNA